MDNINTDQVKFVSTTATINEPCQFDMVQMTNTASVIDYTIKSTGYDAVYEPTVMQRYALCPMTCGWKRVDVNPYAETIVTDFFVRSTAGAHPSVENQSTPLTINTVDKLLDQQFIMVELKCVSTLS